MKKLQHNFTTPEQSRRLLDLGLPADSADMIFFDPINLHPYEVPDNKFLIPDTETYTSYERILHGYDATYYLYPCWSVGRLIEIFELCAGIVWENTIVEDMTKTEIIIGDFDAVKNSIDFSKLEE